MFASFNPRRQWRPAPPALKPTFHHLYWDITWFGLFAASTAAFAAVYAARLGASALQIGLLTAGPAVVNLLFTLPAGSWLHHVPIGKAVFRSAFWARILFLPWVFLPLLPFYDLQIWLIVGLILLTSIPGTVLAIGFNALYAATVPLEWRGQVAGIRNALLAVVYVVTSIACGIILNSLPLATGYQVIFTIGFIGAAMSTYHMWKLRDIREEAVPPTQLRAPLGDYAAPGSVRILGMTVRSTVGLRIFARGTNLLRPDILRGRYLHLIGALFLFHFGQYFVIPLFPLRWVEQLGFSDGAISLGTAVFYLAVLVGSIPLDGLTRRWGNRRLVAGGAALLSLYPLLTALMTNLPLYLLTSLLGGLAWAFVGGALANHLLDNIPTGDRPAHLAWYNFALNAAILGGSLVGPMVAATLGLVNALLVGFVLRLLAGVALWLGGSAAQPADNPSPDTAGAA